MLAPPGYTPLADLWAEFGQQCGFEIYAHACKLYQTRKFISAENWPGSTEFGSPRDYLEEVFFQTLRSKTLSVCSKAGDTFRLKPNAADRSSDIFLRLTVFESTIAAEDEARRLDGPDWLRWMGSGTFAPWPKKFGSPKLWGNTYPPLESSESGDNRAPSFPFHTLPMWFERHRFVVPSELPPWTHDAIDEAFLRSTLPGLLGRSICLDDKQAKQWRTDNLVRHAYRSEMGVEVVDPPAPGRPGKQEQALTYYNELYPQGNHPSLKHAVSEIRQKYNFDVSTKTLARVLKNKSGQK